MNGAAFLGVEVDPGAHPAAARDAATSTTHDRILDEALARGRRGARSRRGALDRARRQRGRRAARARAPRRHARPRDRSDGRARPAERLRPRTASPLDEAAALRASATRTDYVRRASASMADQVQAMLDLQQRGRGRRSTTATTSAPQALEAGVDERVRIPGLRARRTSARSSARARGRSAGSRSPAIRDDIRRTDALVLELFPRRRARSCAGSRSRASEVAFQGLPARICWLGYGERARVGLALQRAGARRAR